MTVAQRTRAAEALGRESASATPFAFWRSWLRNPVAVGLPFESSPWAARRLARTALDAKNSAAPLLELGAGTGRVTEALIDLGCAAGDIVVVERDAQLCRLLDRRFRGVEVVHGDALHLDELLAKTGITALGAAVSGLPMRAIPAAAAGRCYAAAFERLPPGGLIVQYTYGLQPPVDPAAGGFAFEATFVGREWRNLPPLGIWRYRLPSRRVP
jgi:phosphatidylethanolamine/phosphatidyl-N-methylethanolamine N-methyltransferase